MTNTTILQTPEAIGTLVAADMLRGLASAEGRPYVIGFPAGRTANPVVDALVRQAHDQHADLSRLYIVMMDDYVQPDGNGYRRIDEHLAHSCLGWAIRGLAKPLADLGYTRDHLLAPDPADPGSLPRKVADLGGVDLFVVASGQSDGHVALNGPGTPVDAHARIVPLSETTRTDNLSTFPHLRSLDDVPTHGVTLGPADFTDLCHSVAMLLWGTHKTEAFERITSTDDYAPQWPATIIHRCKDPRIIADAAAAGTTA